MIAITFALPAESSEFLRRPRNKYRADRNGIRSVRGNIGDREIEVLHTGVGEKICKERLRKFLRDQRFDLLISTGFAGALNDQLRPNDLLLAKNFSTIDLKSAQSGVAGLLIHSGDMLTVSALLDSREERKKIAHATHAVAVDMETEFIARACAAHAIPLLSLRIITDTPSEQFPAPPEVLFDIERQKTSLIALAKFFVVRPHRVPLLVRFVPRIARARNTLANALVDIIRQL
jgi:adenosylhomocysteine nucleosidase